MDLSFDRSMMEEELRSKIKALCDAHGVSGFEGDAREVVKKEIEEYVDEVKVDALGNLIAYRKGNGKLKLMVAAHLDEIGLVVKKVDEKGFLWFDVAGGVRPQVLISRPVTIKTEKGFVKGIVNHLKPGRPEGITEVPENVEDFFIDVGARSKEEVAEMGIEVGNPVSLNYDVINLGKNRIAGKALDDRLCVFMLIELLKLLKDEEDVPDLYAVFTTQEEVGLRGARVSAYSINPDLSLALDISLANDIPGTPDRKVITELDKGPVIKVMDLVPRAMLGLISSSRVVSELKTVAKEAGLDYQIEVYTAGSTDASATHLERGGIESGAICVPARYVHAYEVVSIDDTLESIDLLYRYVKKLAKR